MKNSSFRRFNFVGIFFALLGTLILLQIFRIQTSAETKGIKDQSEAIYSVIDKTLDPERGQIYDRWGNLLAGNKIVYEVGVDMNTLANPDGIASALATIVGADYADVTKRIQYAKDNSLLYIPLVNYVEPAKIDEIFIRFVPDDASQVAALKAGCRVNSVYGDWPSGRSRVAAR